MPEQAPHSKTDETRTEENRRRTSLFAAVLLRTSAFSRSLACLAISIWCTLSAISIPAHSEIAFVDVSTAAGVSLTSQTYGLAWGDISGDGWPDLYVGNHGDRLVLYRNNRDGTFTDFWTLLSPSGDGEDWHSASWADFDNDGDQDLVVIVGAAGQNSIFANKLFVNQGGTFQEQAAGYGIDYPLGRGRQALWWDRNDDGLLDLVVTNMPRSDAQAPSTLFQRTESSFISIPVFEHASIIFDLKLAQIGDFTNDGVPELMINSSFTPTYRILDTSTLPFTDISETVGVGRLKRVVDAAVVDLNGDQLLDLFLARRPGGRGPDVFQTSSTSLKILVGRNGIEQGIDIGTMGDLSLDVSSWTIERSEIFIGSGGTNPSSFSFTLSAADVNHHGLFPHDAGDDIGAYVGYDPISEKWLLRISSISLFEAAADASESITSVDLLGFEIQTNLSADQLFLQDPTGMIDATAGSGLEALTGCDSVGAGDFDNDMDVDLYFVCSRPTWNEPNILFENLGNGTFVTVPGAGGALGATVGRGDSVAVADYDKDGFLDLFVSNGWGAPPLGLGPHQLFRNVGNDNHWIEIDLVGAASNRDGIGARVFVTAGGVTQLRLQGNGMHARSQDHMRLHFGLGSNVDVEEVLVEWPSGTVGSVGPVSADQILVVTEFPVRPPVPALASWAMFALASAMVGVAAAVLRYRSNA